MILEILRDLQNFHDVKQQNRILSLQRFLCQTFLKLF